MKARLIVNPKARQGGVNLDQVLDRLRERGWDVDRVETTGPGAAVDLAREAAAGNLEVVVACGGDGTINEVVNGLATTGTALGVIPLGTANVFAAEMGIPKNPVEAADALVDGRIREVDLGLAGDRYFLLMAGIGLDAEVIQSVPPTLKKQFGVAAFVMNGVRKVFGFQGERAILAVDGTRYRRWLRLAVIGNTRLYGGLVTMTHDARIDDGWLDVAIFSNRGGWVGMTRQLLQVLLRRPDAKSGYEYIRGRSIRVWTLHRIGVQVDGEWIGQTPMHFQVAPLALRVLLPHPVPRGPFSDSDLAEGEDQPVAPALTSARSSDETIAGRGPA